MKKLRLSRKKSTDVESSSRITNETVEEHRKRVLAGGRRFKYPVQYARHRLVINTILISVVALVAITIIIWWQLYPSQNTSTFFYRITRVVPLPVASVDGQTVRYSDYLVVFRSQEHYLQHIESVDLYSKENQQQLAYIKRQALDNAESDSYAAKLANENHVTVTAQQIDDAIKRQRESSDGLTSQETYDAIVLDHFGWTPDEAREVTARKLLTQEVSYKIDSTALKLRDETASALGKVSDFDKVAAAVAPVNGVHIEAGVTPLVPKNNQDGGLAETASKLEVGQISPAFRSTTGDGYYFVKLLQKDNNGRISYAYLRAPLTEFQKKLDKVKSQHHVTEFVSIPAVKSPVTQ